MEEHRFFSSHRVNIMPSIYCYILDVWKVLCFPSSYSSPVLLYILCICCLNMGKIYYTHARLLTYMRRKWYVDGVEAVPNLPSLNICSNTSRNRWVSTGILIRKCETHTIWSVWAILHRKKAVAHYARSLWWVLVSLGWKTFAQNVRKNRVYIMILKNSFLRQVSWASFFLHSAFSLFIRVLRSPTANRKRKHQRLNEG